MGLSLLVSPFYKNISIPPTTHRISQQQKTIWHLKRSFMYFLWYQILKKRSFKVIKLHVSVCIGESNIVFYSFFIQPFFKGHLDPIMAVYVCSYCKTLASSNSHVVPVVEFKAPIKYNSIQPGVKHQKKRKFARSKERREGPNLHASLHKFICK